MVLVAVVVLAGCTPQPTSPAAPGSPAPASVAAPTPTPTFTPTPSATAFDAGTAVAAIEHLAGIGPREATGAGFDAAADWVAGRFAAHGYTVTAQEFDVPAGNSWGVAVGAGTSRNVIADPPDFDPTQPHLVVGAHLDTVPQSPGAEDNASGVAVMLEVARMVSEQPAALPVRFIAFGAEEPRGQGDERHHYGSRHYVAQLDQAERDGIEAMVSLDRVGAPADAVPVGTGGTGTTDVADQLVTAAAGIPTRVDRTNRTSDHWSFEKAGIPAARLGSIPFDGYHSPRDTPDVVDADQLADVGAIMWSWLHSWPA